MKEERKREILDFVLCLMLFECNDLQKAVLLIGLRRPQKLKDERTKEERRKERKKEENLRFCIVFDVVRL